MMKGLISLALLVVDLSWVHASTDLGPWIPIFKGIDHAVGTNTPGGGGFPDLQVVHALRIDLSDLDIQLFSTPRITNYLADSRETAGLTVSDFLATNRLQVAINANNFSPQQYYLPAGTPMDISGLAISQGQVVSAQEGPADSASILFTTNNQPTIVFTNWPPHSNAGIFTAVSGLYPVLINGVNVGSNYINNPNFPHNGTEPRTTYGLSQDRRYLYLLTIDGRQAGYSDGAWDWETGAWLLLVGASDGVNMDGGGSTTLVVQDSTGFPVELNKSSAVANDPQGRERTVGNHFGVFAKPVPGFINDVVALPDDTAATITWTTIAPSTSQVQYDLTTNFSNVTTLQSSLVTNHAVLLTGLMPDTGYYFQVISSAGTNQYVSSNFFFVTTNYVTPNQLFDVTNSWKYTSVNLDGVNWTATNYNDSTWSGPGSGLLWVDNRGPNPAIQPKNTVMPGNPNNNGFPYTTYYFRTHFTVTDRAPGTALLFSSYVDDGAVFYLNGNEVYRLRMDPAPTPILNSTLASGFPCSGDATCSDEFSISGDLVTNLVAGDNVLAVEVHNYNRSSRDITFGTALFESRPYISEPQLNISYAQGTVTLNWSRGGFALQQADAPAGPWTNVPGPIVISPFTSTNLTGAQYFRLLKP